MKEAAILPSFHEQLEDVAVVVGPEADVVEFPRVVFRHLVDRLLDLAVRKKKVAKKKTAKKARRKKAFGFKKASRKKATRKKARRKKKAAY